MYTKYNSQKISESTINGNNNVNEYNNPSKQNKIFSILWKILLVIIVLILLFFALIKFQIISLTSSIAPDAILLMQNEIGIVKGSSYQLVSAVLPENSNNKQVVWSSSDPDIVSVNEVTGYIEGLKVGTAVVTVKTLINDKTSECVVNVTDRNVLVTKISINEKYISLAVGYQHNLTYNTFPTNATELGLKFTSSDTTVATVNANGVIKGIKEGSAIITVSSSNGLVKDTAYITVYKKGSSTVVDGESIKTETYPSSIELESETINLTVGSTNQLISKVNPSVANQKISWTSSNSNIVTVDSNGLVTAKAVGTATIIARTINNLVDVCTVTVGNYSLKLKGISITTDYARLPIGATKQLVVVFNPSNATDKTINWSSDNPSVVSVDSSGKIKAISAGSAIITAKASDGGYTDTVTIEVEDYSNIIDEESISFKNQSYSVGVNNTITLIPIITPTNASFKSVSFESADTSVATIDQNGVIKGISPGQTTITAITKNRQLKASVVVTVKNIPSTGVSLNTTSTTINLNNTFTLIPDIIPNNASNQTVTFTTDNPNIATIDQNGIITAVGIGTTTITVTPNGGGNSSTCIVTVN